MRLYVALREAAHQRLFGHVPWLRGHVLNAVETYANGITVNREAIEEAMGRIDPTDPESMQELAARGHLHARRTRPQQKAALARLETALALVEGWVCHVVDSAAGDRLPNVGPPGRGVPPPPGRRRPGRADVRRAGRPGAAPPAAARGGGAVGGAHRAPRHRRAATRSGATPTCCPTDEDFADPDGFARSQGDSGLPDFDDIGDLGFDKPRPEGQADPGADAEGPDAPPEEPKQT